MTRNIAEYLSDVRGINVSTDASAAVNEDWDRLQGLRPVSGHDTTDAQDIPVTFDPTAGRSLE